MMRIQQHFLAEIVLLAELLNRATARTSLESCAYFTIVEGGLRRGGLPLALPPRMSVIFEDV